MSTPYNKPCLQLLKSDRLLSTVKFSEIEKKSGLYSLSGSGTFFNGNNVRTQISLSTSEKKRNNQV